MRLRAPAMALWIAVAACASSRGTEPAPVSLVGTSKSSLPGGMEERLSWLLDTAGTGRWAVSRMRIAASGAEFLTLDHHDPASADSIPWTVTALLDLPRGGTYALGRCRRDGTPDPAIVAHADSARGDSLRRIRHAWRADTAARRFTPIATRAIVCENEDAGPVD